MDTQRPSAGADRLRELLLRAQAREDTAWPPLLKELTPSLFARVKAITGNPEDAHDLVQETFLRLLEHPFDPARGCPWGFAAIIATRLAIDWRRRQRLRRSLSLNAENGIEVGDERGDPARAAEAKEAAEELRRAMARLPPRQRATLELLYFDDRTRKEASRVQGIPAGTVATRVWAALHKLHARLGRRLGEVGPRLTKRSQRAARSPAAQQPLPTSVGAPPEGARLVE